MEKDISGSSVIIKDQMGNRDSLSWSRAANVDASSANFEPGFNFKVFVMETGNIQVIPADNDSTSDNLSKKEEIYFNGETSALFTAVPAFTELPILCKAILSAGTTSTDVLIGK
jgi:hypothetical protein